MGVILRIISWHTQDTILYGFLVQGKCIFSKLICSWNKPVMGGKRELNKEPQSEMDFYPFVVMYIQGTFMKISKLSIKN